MAMDAIFHEKQEGSLCAQHCLNALLQGPYFSAVDLAEIARQLDETEREQMAVGGTDNEGYQQFLEQPSNNYDDSGFFSVQVIDKALRVWGLELLPYNSQNPVSQQARQDPTTMQSFICNFGEHWLTVRRIGNQWFNLNSLLTGPELISDTYLGMFLTQLQQDGYSIFIIVGDLLECEADQLLRLCPVVQPIKPELITEKNKKSDTDEKGGDNVQRAIDESKNLAESDDISLQRALQLSMEGYIEESVTRIETACTDCDKSSMNNQSATEQPKPSSAARSVPGTSNQSQVKSGDPGSQSEHKDTGHTLGGSTERSQGADGGKKPDVDEMRQKRLAFLDKLKTTAEGGPVTGAAGKSTEESEGNKQTKSNGTDDAVGDLTEEEMLERAIAMSMDQEK